MEVEVEVSVAIVEAMDELYAGCDCCYQLDRGTGSGKLLKGELVCAQVRTETIGAVLAAACLVIPSLDKRLSEVPTSCNSCFPPSARIEFLMSTSCNVAGVSIDETAY